MKNLIIVSAACLALVGCTGTKEAQKEEAPLKRISQIDFSHVKIEDGFWSPRLSKHTTATLPVCIDQIENRMQRKEKENIRVFSSMTQMCIRRWKVLHIV